MRKSKTGRRVNDGLIAITPRRLADWRDLNTLATLDTTDGPARPFNHSWKRLDSGSAMDRRQTLASYIIQNLNADFEWADNNEGPVATLRYSINDQYRPSFQVLTVSFLSIERTNHGHSPTIIGTSIIPSKFSAGSLICMASNLATHPNELLTDGHISYSALRHDTQSSTCRKGRSDRHLRLLKAPVP